MRKKAPKKKGMKSWANRAKRGTCLSLNDLHMNYVDLCYKGSSNACDKANTIALKMQTINCPSAPTQLATHTYHGKSKVKRVFKGI